MGLYDFTTADDDAQNGGKPGGPASAPTVPGNGSAGPFGLGINPAPQTPASSNDVPEMLINYNERFKTASPTLFRDTVIEQTMAVTIGSTKPNTLLKGHAGVGKTRIVEEIARRIATSDASVPDQLKKTTIFELLLASLVAGSGLVGAIEEKVQSVVDFATDPNNDVIIFIDEIHLLVDSRDSTYSKIAQILKPALARGNMRVIGATTSQESRGLDTDPAFSRRFSHLVVDELTPVQTLEVLKSVRGDLITHYLGQITVEDEVLESTVRIADAHSRAGNHRPDNAITLLDRAMADRVLEHKRTLAAAIANPDPVAQQLAQTLQQMPSVALTQERVLAVARRLLTGNAVKHVFDVDELRQDLDARIQGQTDALEQVVDLIAREEMNLFPRKTPLAFMFAGSSGAGKTETVKILAQHVTDQDPIILNMTEYNSSAAQARIIGSPAGYVGYDSNAELPFDALDSNPHRVILLDEFEKSDISVQRLFLSALDEGVLRTSRGKVIDFSKAIVIATTNAARDALSGRSAGFGSQTREISHRSLINTLSKADGFDAELLARFSLVIGFQPITPEIYADIVAADYARERTRIAAENPRYAALLPDEIPADEIRTMVNDTFQESQGARPAKKAVRAWIEDQILATQRQKAPVTASAGTPATAHAIENA